MKSNFSYEFTTETIKQSICSFDVNTFVYPILWAFLNTLFKRFCCKTKSSCSRFYVLKRRWFLDINFFSFLEDIGTVKTLQRCSMFSCFCAASRSTCHDFPYCYKPIITIFIGKVKFKDFLECCLYFLLSTTLTSWAHGVKSFLVEFLQLHPL